MEVSGNIRNGRERGHSGWLDFRPRSCKMCWIGERVASVMCGELG